MMTDTELYSHFKKTAPIGDLEFFVAHTRGFPELQDAAATLRIQKKLSRAAFMRQLKSLHERWRIASSAADRAAADVAAAA